MKGPKREKPKTKTKSNIRKTPNQRVTSSNSYLANYDSRKELHKKITLSNASGKRGRRHKADARSKGEGVSQDSEVLGGTGSDFVKEVGPGKSTFFKKNKGEVYVESPVGIYGDVGKVSPWKGQAHVKNVSLSKTDDLKFLKEIAQKKNSKSRRGSSAFTNENKLHVQSSHNSQQGRIDVDITHESHKTKAKQKSEVLSSNNVSTSKTGGIVKISRSLVVGKRETKKTEPQREAVHLRSSRDTKDQIEYLKKKYFGKSSKVVSLSYELWLWV
jgi:hypothetical protein